MNSLVLEVETNFALLSPQFKRMSFAVMGIMPGTVLVAAWVVAGKWVALPADWPLLAGIFLAANTVVLSLFWLSTSHQIRFEPDRITLRSRFKTVTVATDRIRFLYSSWFEGAEMVGFFTDDGRGMAFGVGAGMSEEDASSASHWLRDLAGERGLHFFEGLTSEELVSLRREPKKPL